MSLGAGSCCLFWLPTTGGGETALLTFWAYRPLVSSFVLILRNLLAVWKVDSPARLYASGPSPILFHVQKYKINNIDIL